MHRREFIGCGAAGLISARNVEAAQISKPNIVVIYADDLGYGDTGAYGATRVKTPNIDRMASRGVRFTDAHTSAATCTPSRYSLLTGEYSFRMQGARVLPGDAPALIRPGRTTMASMLRSVGYRTGVIGKWHLGLGDGDVDWNTEIRPGPLDIGFDESFIIPATGDRVPCVYVENRRVAGLDSRDPIAVSYKGPLDDAPTGKTHPELLKLKPSHGHDMTIVNGISRIGYMKGGKAALWNDETMADDLAKRADGFIERNRRQPFFLYFATHDIHVPRAPHQRFAGATPMGRRGDVIAEFDWTVGQIVSSLERRGLLNNTLIVLSSDNGAVIDDGYQDEAVTKLGDHKANGPLRGGKYSLFEGGTRVPFLVQWPTRIKPGVSEALVSQMDLMRSFADLTGAKLDKGTAPDSENLLRALLDSSMQGRKELVEQANGLALRSGTWKYIEPGKGQRLNANTNTETGVDPEAQLYDLSTDLGETTNLAKQQPDRVMEMAEALARIRR